MRPQQIKKEQKSGIVSFNLKLREQQLL